MDTLLNGAGLVLCIVLGQTFGALLIGVINAFLMKREHKKHQQGMDELLNNLREKFTGSDADFPEGAITSIEEL